MYRDPERGTIYLNLVSLFDSSTFISLFQAFDEQPESQNPLTVRSK